jgi:hypothetical protein
MTLQNWIRWAFEPWPTGRHPFHSYALARQAERDMGEPVSHDEFIAAMKAAGYREKARYGRAVYFDCLDTAEKRKYYRQKYLACDDRAQHPLNLRQYPGALIT